MMPVRIQRKRTKGWKMPPNTVSVTRPGKWGNPFNLKSSEHCWTALAYGCKANPAGRQAASVKMFREWIEAGKIMVVKDCGLYIGTDADASTAIAVSPPVAAYKPPSLDEVRRELRGKNLACFCKPGDPCHADVLLELANAEERADGSAA
jgi:hypothetical protein